MAVVDHRAAPADLTEDQRAQLAAALRPRLTVYNGAEPLSAKQQAGLLLPQNEVLYGGAAGGGKSSWLLHAAAQYVDVPGYSAVIFRRSYKQLEEAGAIMDRSKLWWGNTDAEWSESAHRWTFPSGAKIAFRYLEGANDWMNYQGPEFQFVGFDELTQFLEKQYTYLFSRLRKPKRPEEWPKDQWHSLGPKRKRLIEGLSKVPLRMRSGSNPGGPGADWVKQRFGLYVPDGDEDRRRLCERPEWVAKHSRVFLPAKVRDNPGLNVADYTRQLQHLDPTTRAQYLEGDWEAKEPGEFFRREWFQILDHMPNIKRAVRYWDLAATEPSERNHDPDYTVGVKLAQTEIGWVVLDVQRGRWRSETVERRVAMTAEMDGAQVMIGMEQEPGSAGKSLIRHYQANVLRRYGFRGYPPADSKAVRARPVAAKCEAGMVSLLRGQWIQSFLDELEIFPPDKGGGHDDQVDALTGAFQMLEGRPRWHPL